MQSSITYVLTTNVENLILTGTSAINGTGNTLDNYLTGNAGNNVLSGGTGGGHPWRAGWATTPMWSTTLWMFIVENTGEGTDLVQASISFILAANVGKPDPHRNLESQRIRQRFGQCRYRQQRR